MEELLKWNIIIFSQFQECSLFALKTKYRKYIGHNLESKQKMVERDTYSVLWWKQSSKIFRNIWHVISGSNVIYFMQHLRLQIQLYKYNLQILLATELPETLRTCFSPTLECMNGSCKRKVIAHWREKNTSCELCQWKMLVAKLNEYLRVEFQIRHKNNSERVYFNCPDRYFEQSNWHKKQR